VGDGRRVWLTHPCCRRSGSTRCRCRFRLLRRRRRRPRRLQDLRNHPDKDETPQPRTQRTGRDACVERQRRRGVVRLTAVARLLVWRALPKRGGVPIHLMRVSAPASVAASGGAPRRDAAVGIVGGRRRKRALLRGHFASAPPRPRTPTGGCGGVPREALGVGGGGGGFVEEEESVRDEGWVWELRGGGRGAAQGRGQRKDGGKERRDATRSRCVRACLCGGARLRSGRIRRALDATDRSQGRGQGERGTCRAAGRRPPAIRGRAALRLSGGVGVLANPFRRGRGGLRPWLTTCGSWGVYGCDLVPFFLNANLIWKILRRRS
jgi:hypothetical protein